MIPPPDRPIGDGARAGKGMRLPPDYLELLDVYGPGCFDQFLWLLSPGNTNPNLDLQTQTANRLAALRSVADRGELIPGSIEPLEENLVPWAVTDNGDVCYWQTSAVQDPESWTVVVNEGRGSKWERYDGTASSFLADVFAHRRTVGIFPSDFPSPRPAFEPG